MLEIVQPPRKTSTTTTTTTTSFINYKSRLYLQNGETESLVGLFALIITNFLRQISTPRAPEPIVDYKQFTWHMFLSLQFTVD